MTLIIYQMEQQSDHMTSAMIVCGFHQPKNV